MQIRQPQPTHCTEIDHVEERKQITEELRGLRRVCALVRVLGQSAQGPKLLSLWCPASVWHCTARDKAVQ